MLSRLTIRTRVIAAFALVLCATMGLGVFSVQKLTMVNNDAEEIANDWLPGANVLGDLSQDFEIYRSRQAQALSLKGDARNKALTELSDAEAAIQADLKTYEPLVSEDAEVALNKDIHDSLDNYMGYSAPFLAKLAANDEVAAADFFATAMHDSTQTVRKAIHADRAYQITEGNIAAEEGYKTGKRAEMLIFTALGVTAALCALIGWGMIRGISVPIKGMSGIMRILAQGNLETRVPNLGETNEIGDMAAAVEVFKDGMIRNRALEAAAEQARVDSEANRKKIMHDLADAFENAVGEVVEMVSSAATEMQATATQLSSNAYEAAAQAITVSAAAEEAGTNVTSVAGSAEELGASVQEISRQVEHSSVKARAAVKEADTTAAIVHELSESAGKINGILDLISGIASQTNLLALNATIESARAGEAGKGFAVVASEVKILAGQTSKATADINTQISEIQATTRRAVEAIGNISGTVREINDSSATIAAAVDQQGAATHEIVQAVTQASIGTTEVTHNITGVARMAEETGAGAAQVLSASSELAHQAEYLRNQMQAFLRQVRAA